MCILKTDRCYKSPEKEIFLLYNNKSVMTSVRAKEKFAPFELCAKQSKTNNAIIPSKYEWKKGKEKKIVYQFVFLEIKQSQSRSVITHPTYVIWSTICIGLITKVKILRRKLNLFKHTLCFAFFKKYRICTSHFFYKFENSFAKCDMRSANSNPVIYIYVYIYIYISIYIYLSLSIYIYI